MSGYDTDLHRRCLLFGLEPQQTDGWRTRGAASLDIQAATLHHTAGARKGVQPSLGVCIRGRGEPNPLAGPLCNIFGPREESRRVVLVAAGRANHAGPGGWKGVTGNSHTGGLEEEHSGTADEPMSPLRVERACRTIAAMLHGQAGADMAHRHGEWATPKGRKTDFVPSLISGDYLRQRVASLLANPGQPWPGHTPTPEEPDMTPEQVARQERIERLLEGMSPGLSTYGDGGNLNDYRILDHGPVVQLINGGLGRDFHTSAIPGTKTQETYTDTAKGPRTRVDFTVELADVDPPTVRWFTYDPAREGFPGRGDLKSDRHLVKDGAGWHYVDIHAA